MKGLDANVLVRLLIHDDLSQAKRITSLFTSAEAQAQQYFVSTLVLELIWVLESVYLFRRDEVIEALELLAQMPVLMFENYAVLQRLFSLGRTTNIDLPDLLIGLAGQSFGCELTLTLEKGLERTGLFERVRRES